MVAVLVECARPSSSATMILGGCGVVGWGGGGVVIDGGVAVWWTVTTLGPTLALCRYAPQKAKRTHLVTEDVLDGGYEARNA